MSELRDRLARKARRRVTVSVAISDATEAVSVVQGLDRELFMLSAKANAEEERAGLEEKLTAARAAVAEHYADVEFEACPPGDFEALQTDFTAEDGGVDAAKLSANLPALAAACAVENDLRDEEFWRSSLESGAWSYGERVSLANRLISLNVVAPDERIPFA